MKVSTEIDNNFGYEKITQLVDNIPLRKTVAFVYLCSTVSVYCLYKGEDVLSWKTCI